VTAVIATTVLLVVLMLVAVLVVIAIVVHGQGLVGLRLGTLLEDEWLDQEHPLERDEVRMGDE
jgi:hypothetical protein